MDEADSPKQPTGLPTPLEPTEIPAVIESIASDVSSTGFSGWQTVDFPGAMSVDAIPHSDRAAGHTEVWHPPALGETVSQGVMHYSSAEISPETTYMVTFPSETVEPTSTIGQRPIAQQPSEPAQEHLQQLLQELERSHQTAQRQQILVETLTEQLGSSQERIAQLERDCALTQQRHSEQVQQVLQAESACRDLRLRLHRQQQQTLQFKAALEKCLEMPTAYGQPIVADVALAGDVVAPDSLSGLPRNSPVQPWSLVEKASHEPADLPRPLSKLLNGFAAQEHDIAAAIAPPFSGSLPNDETVSADHSALLDSDDPQFVTHLMQLIFPTTTESSDAAVLQTVPLLDCSPALELDCSPALETDEATASANAEALSMLDGSSPDTDGTAPAPLLDDQAPDPLWDDLATLIDPSLAERIDPAEAVDRPDISVDLTQTSVASDSALVPLAPPTASTGTAAIPPIFAADAPPVASSPLADLATTVPSQTAPSQTAPSQTAPSQTAWTWRDRLVSAGKVARSTDTGTTQAAQCLALAGQQPVQEPVSAARSASLIPPSFTMPPSPIVYPSRSTRKLDSLAAVDLPTFPKRGK